MYNRYIPQPDGSYRRRSISDPGNFSPAPPDKPSPSTPPPAPPENTPQVNRAPSGGGQPPRRPVPSSHSRPPVRPSHSQQKPLAAGSFLKQLLPKNLDTEDLIVVLLLLLMAGDEEKESNSALLTLALYLFL